ncbi:MAG: orotidine-5'-phosphate decarboxylase, partial [Candidatus Omnitrophota bacterium]
IGQYWRKYILSKMQKTYYRTTRFLSDIIKEKVDVFLDLKLYDIPNTMKRTASVIAQLGCWAFTVHLQAGEKALAAVKEEVVNVSKQRGCRLPLILGVTILTSSQSVDSDVDGLVGLADKVGIDGVIASARDARRIKSNYPDIKVVTPGIRNTGDDIGDQLRITTAQVAFEAGVDYIVVGRPIINEDNYLDAAKHLLEG